MKYLKIILSFSFLLVITFSCIKKKESNQFSKGASNSQSLTPAQIERQKAREAWVAKRKAASEGKGTVELTEEQKTRRAWLKKTKAARDSLAKIKLSQVGKKDIKLNKK